MDFIYQLFDDSLFRAKVSIPITCAFVGWSTNWVAVEMIFKPRNFWGIWKLGWQGIIPHHAEKMTKMITEILTQKLMTPQELYRRVDPNIINREISDLINLTSAEIVQDIIEGENPQLWAILPDMVKKSIENEISTEIPKQMVNVYHAYGSDLDSVLEFDIVVKEALCGKNVGVLIELFKRCGGPEFRFIIVSGIYFGFIIGLVQLAFLSILGQWWTFPIMGVIVGYITNWLALQMIFRPLEEKDFFFFKYQGLFLRRQNDVSREWANVVATKVLNSENMMRLIFQGKAGDLLVKLVMDSANKGVEKMMQTKVPIAPIILGTERTQRIKTLISDKIVAMLPMIADRVEDYITQTLKIEETIYSRLIQLPKDKFEELLHSVFKEDEMTLILLGAFLGGMVGLAQATLVIDPSQLPAFLKF